MPGKIHIAGKSGDPRDFTMLCGRWVRDFGYAYSPDADGLDCFLHNFAPDIHCAHCRRQAEKTSNITPWREAWRTPNPVRLPAAIGAVSRYSNPAAAA